MYPIYWRWHVCADCFMYQQIICCLERRGKVEDKKEIIFWLKRALQATRAGAGIASMVLLDGGDTVRIVFNSGCRKDVNIACDSGIAVIKDVAAALM